MMFSPKNIVIERPFAPIVTPERKNDKPTERIKSKISEDILMLSGSKSDDDSKIDNKTPEIGRILTINRASSGSPNFNKQTSNNQSKAALFQT